MKVSFVPKTVTTAPAVVGVIVDDDATLSYANLAAVQSSNLCKWKLIPAGSTDPVTIITNWSAKKTFGGNVMSNNDLSAAFGANPVEQSYGVCFVNIMGSGSQDFYAMVEIEYITICYELIQQQYS